MLGMAQFFLLLLFRLSLSEHSVDIDRHMQYDCNTTCLLHSALPVCGSDKITYNDECSLKAEACASGKPLIVVHEGQCSEYLNHRLNVLALFQNSWKPTLQSVK